MYLTDLGAPALERLSADPAFSGSASHSASRSYQLETPKHAFVNTLVVEHAAILPWRLGMELHSKVCLAALSTKLKLLKSEATQKFLS